MITVILLMAGNSTRMNMNENKIFLPLGEKKVFQYSLDLFLEMGFEVICVVQDRVDDFKFYQDKGVQFISGGKTRQESVYLGLGVAKGDIVLIHDAARPFISKRVVEECLVALAKGKYIVVGTPSKDTIYNLEPLEVLNRKNLICAQTPQGGKKEQFLQCHVKAIQDGIEFTDDISLVQHYLNPEIEVIQGEDSNFKITTKLDYIVAMEMIKGV